MPRRERGEAKREREKWVKGKTAGGGIRQASRQMRAGWLRGLVSHKNDGWHRWRTQTREGGKERRKPPISLKQCDFVDLGSPSTPGLSVFTSELKKKKLRFTHLCTSEASLGPLKGRRPFSGAMTRIFEWSLLHGRMGTLTVPVVLSHSMDKDVCICVFKVSPPQDLSLSVLQKTSASVFLF